MTGYGPDTSLHAEMWTADKMVRSLIRSRHSCLRSTPVFAMLLMTFHERRMFETQFGPDRLKSRVTI